MVSDTSSQPLRGSAGVSFPVHDVAPETSTGPFVSMSDSLISCMKSGDGFAPSIIAVSDREGSYRQLPSQNAFLASVHIAFSEHRPLILSPDIIWLAILQGFGRHIHAHARELEGRLMLDSGKHSIRVEMRSESWDWAAAFGLFATALEGHAGAWIRDLQADFSTTGPIERTASHVALMDLFSPYVQYIIACVCGIPSIQLRGNTADWTRLRNKAGLLRGYNADEWIDEIDGILSRFIDAAHGRVDRPWWQQIYKLSKRYGGENIEGWLGAFFPYLKDEQGGFTRRRRKDEIYATDIVPPGLSAVPVRFETPTGSDSLRVVSGFLGVEDLADEGITPKIGWAVVRNHFMEGFVAHLDEQPALQRRLPAVVEESDHPWLGCFETLPVDLQLFYRATDGAELYDKVAIYPHATLLDAPRVGHTWQHLGAWRDGSLLLIGPAIVRLQWTKNEWIHQTVGTGFSDFIARLVTANGKDYWKDPTYVEPKVLPLWSAFNPPTPSSDDCAAGINLLFRQNRRLRSMKLATSDVFAIRPPSSEDLDHFPHELRSFYQLCDGVIQAAGFEIWPSNRATPLPDTQMRWFEIGGAPGYRIILDVAADRGVAVVDVERQTTRQIASSLAEFLKQVDRAPQTIYWNEARVSRIYPTESVLWPDETIE